MNMTDSKMHGFRGCSAMRKWLIGRKLRKLNLDHNQVEKLEELLDNARPASQGHHKMKIELQECISAILADDDFTQDKAAVLIRTAADQHVERAVEIVAAFGEFYQGLEPEQQLQLQSMWQKRRNRASPCCH